MPKTIPAVFLCLFLSLFLPGCVSKEKPDTVAILTIGHSVIAGPLEKELVADLRFSVRGKKASDPINAASVAVADEAVVFRLSQEPAGAGARLGDTTATSDARGDVATRLSLGNRPGLYQVEARLVNHPDIPPAEITILGGITLGGSEQDGWIGEDLARPISIRIESAPGVFLGPGEGQVRFDLRSGPVGTRLTQEAASIDSEGSASTRVTLGNRSGPGEIGVRIERGIPGVGSLDVFLPVTFLAVDGWSMLSSILGGLALFLFGMRLMSDGLHRTAGDRMRSLLGILTRNRLMAVAAGAGVTALIQSSSASTVMVVGFLNAGLMQLEQAIGIIMGANIGTTLTAQIIAFRLSNIALPAILVGVILTIVARRQLLRNWGGTIIGFGIIFLGMNTMSGALEIVKNSAYMTSLFRNIDFYPDINGWVPFLPFFRSIGIGLAATLLMQSSAATIGVLLVLVESGLIGPFAAFGVLLGDNIGTTVTAVLAAIASGIAARRAACFHVMFNVCGCALMIGLNYVEWPGHRGRPIFMDFVNTFTPGDVFAGQNIPRFLANAHTLFNFSCTILFLPFVTQFATLSRLIIKGGSGSSEMADSRLILEPHLLSTPSLAIQQVWAEVGVMLGKGREAQTEGFRTITSTDTPDWDQVAKNARQLEQETDELQAAITDYLSNIPLTGLSETQSELFPHLIRTVNDAERIGDLGRHLSKLGKRVKKRSLPISPEAIEEMTALTRVVDTTLQLAEKAVTTNADGIETGAGGAALRMKFLEEGKRLEKSAKTMANEFRKSHEKRHALGTCDIRSGVIFIEAVNSLARSTGHAVNVIEAACHSAYKRQEK
ncbi:MAG: Na/Pi cotransporter family protein [Planctomycetota bacterium]|jgi:phosphate:Na+ symporter|nr:Na/Pi cotransporter family protein [Planctomycetota bacterium]